MSRRADRLADGSTDATGTGTGVIRIVLADDERMVRAGIRAILTADGWRAAATHPDLTGRDRSTTALRP